MNGSYRLISCSHQIFTRQLCVCKFGKVLAWRRSLRGPGSQATDVMSSNYMITAFNEICFNVYIIDIHGTQCRPASNIPAVRMWLMKVSSVLPFFIPTGH